MRFPHAAKGVSKIFSAEIISLISAVISGIAGLLFVIAAAVNETDENAAAVWALIALILIIPAGVLLVVGGIISIIGYIQAAKDESNFTRAIFCVIGNLVFGILSSCFAGQTGFLGWLCTVFDLISVVMQLLIILFTIFGLMSLSAGCNRPDMVKMGNGYLKTLLALYILGIIIRLMTRVFRTTAFNVALVNILSVCVIILTIVLYFFQLYYLAKAKKMLNEG